MTENPYQSPREVDPPPYQPTGLRSWHVPFIIAVVCGVALAVTSNITFVNPNDAFVCSAIPGTILLLDLSVCGWVIWEWWRTGEPPELSLVGEIYTPESHALFATWKERPQLDDEAFYLVFNAESGIPKQVVISVRRELQSILGMSLAGVHPGDNMEVAAPYLDFADVFYRFEKDLNIVIPWRTGEVDFDGTFDSLVCVVANCASAKASAE